MSNHSNIYCRKFLIQGGTGKKEQEEGKQKQVAAEIHVPIALKELGSGPNPTNSHFNSRRDFRE